MNFFGAAPKPFERTSGDYLPFVYSKVGNAFPSVIGKQPYNTDQETVIAKNPQIIFIDGMSAV
jgi:ABC-type Fe3+-hydroxamate transport system substrate-binding protein